MFYDSRYNFYTYVRQVVLAKLFGNVPNHNFNHNIIYYYYIILAYNTRSDLQRNQEKSINKCMNTDNIVTDIFASALKINL